MRIRVPVLATGAVVVVGIVAALVTTYMLDASGPIDALAMRETTRTLEAVEATAPLPADDAPQTAAAVPQQPQPREPTPEKLREFDVNAAMAHVRTLEGFGVRAGGSPAETAAAGYIRDQLVAIGLDARIEEFPLTNGSTSRNVIAVIPGASDTVLVLGGHFDSKPPSPGANDNASGCAALLEIAAILAERPVVPTIEIVFFGSEEIIGGDPNAHHFGSRYRVAQMSSAERARTAGMLSVDMIGFGSDFHSRTMAVAPMALSDMLLAHAKRLGIGMTYLKDSSSSGLSDHEAYELAGIPASCVAWRQDPVYHTADDVSSHLSTARIATTGRLVLDFVRSLEQADLLRLIER